MSELGGLFLLGVIYGSTLCTLTCLPYLGPYILTTGNGFSDGFSLSFAFLVGKLLTYTALGGMASLLGAELLSGNKVAAQYFTGAILAVVGVVMILSSRKSNECAKRTTVGKKAPLIMLGVSTSMLPCPAVIAMLAMSAKSGSIMGGSLDGAVYGLGVAFSPMLVIGGGVAMIGETLSMKVRESMPTLRILAGVFIALMGAKLLGTTG